MKLTNFNIDNDNIALLYKGQYLDIHNCYEFRGFQFDNLIRTLSLTWTRSLEEWSNEKICGFQLFFRQVNYFKVRERDSELPFSEDTCLSFIGFLGKDMRYDFDSFVPIENAKETDDLNITFQSDQAIKINSAIVEFKELDEEIIYVSLLDEGSDVWRPMWAKRIKEMVYKISTDKNFDRTNEKLQFDVGQIVTCRRQKISDRQCFVATDLEQ